MFIRTYTILEEEEGRGERRVRVGLRVPGLQTRYSCWCEESISVCVCARAPGRRAARADAVIFLET